MGFVGVSVCVRMNTCGCVCDELIELLFICLLGFLFYVGFTGRLC